MRRKKSRAPCQVLDPNPLCAWCKGSGWVPEAASPAMSRDVEGLSKRVEFRPRVVRCACTKAEARAMEPPAPTGIDQAQRAAGETD